MNTLVFIKLYLISVPIFLILDFFWLGIVTKDFYQSRIGHLLEINVLAAVVFYSIFIVGLTVFATMPGTVNDGWEAALVLGALYGFFTYATYDLTNLATLKDWSLHLALVDIAWGTFLSASVAGLASIAGTNLFNI